MEPTITQAEAEKLVGDYVRDSKSRLPSGVYLEEFSATVVPCLDPSDHGPRGRVFATNDYWIRLFPDEQKEQGVGALRGWAEERGFAVTYDVWGAVGGGFVTFENPSNGFRMSVQESSRGDVSYGFSSPCVWPNGTPEPKSR